MQNESLQEINKQGVSIVISARNEFPQVALTINCLMHDMDSSGITKYEIILVDNGSEDETSRFFSWKAVEKGRYWKYQYSPRGLVYEGILRIVYDPVMSNVGARNHGVEWAKYENIIFSDAHITVKYGTILSTITTLNTYGGIVHCPVSWAGSSTKNPSPGFQYSYKVGEKIWGCVDEETEVLTKEGWKKYNEIKKGDYIPTIDLQRKDIDFQPIEDITIWDFDDEAIRFEGQNFDLLMTPDHRCIYTTRNKNEWKIKQAKDIEKKDLLPLSAEWRGLYKSDFNDALVELIGWIITEGNIYDDDPKTRRWLKKNQKEKTRECKYGLVLQDKQERYLKRFC